MRRQLPVRWLGALTMVFAVMFGLTATGTGISAASTTQIQDDANVLDATTVQNTAAGLPVPVMIWTTTEDAANKAAFDNAVRIKVSDAFPVVLGINTAAHHETIQMDRYAGLSQNSAIAAESAANSAFVSSMHSSNNNYTAATTAALGSLKTSLTSGRHGYGPQYGTHRSLVGPFLQLILFVVIIALVVAIVRRVARRRGRPRGGFGPGPMPPNGPYAGPGFDPGSQYGRRGMSAGAAGGIGALGGGLLGYELGKMSGENEQARQDEMMGYDGPGDYSGDSGGGDWTVGQDSDWGGGGDWGGGDSGGGSW